MSSVEDYRERLATLQGAWDTLSMLSHLGGDGTDMGATRQAFETLAADLVRSLSAETYRKSLLALKAKGQIAIDVIVRNLYERTADIGFLCADEDVRKFLKQPPARSDDPVTAKQAAAVKARLRARFREYVAKYSVYHDVILLSTAGEVLARLDENYAIEKTSDALVAETLSTRGGYLETFRKIDLLPDHERSLVYSYRVCDGTQNLGVLCLCFRLDDEVAGIFSKLQEDSDWTVFAYLSERGQVIASSDTWQLPIGATLTLALEESGRILRFAGREYLAITRRTQGYQGYMGPGWYGHAMIPIEHAFDRKESAHNELSADVLNELRSSEAIFSEALRRIPQQADQIQRELNRTIWNGNVRLAERTDGNRDFAKTLLWEIGNAGRRTQETFENSIGDLQETVVSSILQDAQLLASLSVDVLDRNLYERANDCRWWALNATLIEHLSQGSSQREQITPILRHINSLYTVYHDIVLFDVNRRVVANSNKSQESWVGKTINEPWAAQTLALRTSQDFTVSSFVPSALYRDRHTLIFGAVVRDANGRTIGGIGIVFDTGPQFSAMLQDALPRTESGDIAAGCIGLFVDRDMKVVSASADYQPGDQLDLPRTLITDDARTSSIVTLRGTRYAIGVARTTGYREYKGANCIGLVLIPLGSAQASTQSQRRQARSHLQRRAASAEASIDIATFHSGSQWLGVPRSQVIEAVDGGNLRPLPGSPAWHAGLLMYRDAPITVIDLARLVANSATTRGRDVIVAALENGKQHIGLLIDELAEIPEIPVSRILPVTEFATRSGPALVDRAVRPERAEDPVLFIVNIEQILLYTGVLRTVAKTG